MYDCFQESKLEKHISMKVSLLNIHRLQKEIWISERKISSGYWF